MDVRGKGGTAKSRKKTENLKDQGRGKTMKVNFIWMLLILFVIINRGYFSKTE